MKIKILVLSGTLLLAASSFSFAQDANTPPDKPAAGQQDGKRRPPPNPLLRLFDTNHDGVIDAAEIAAAPAVLKALDKNGDGQLTADELCPPRRPKGDKDGHGSKEGKGGGDMPPLPPDDAK